MSASRTGIARPTSFMSGLSGPIACGRNWRRHPIVSSTSPTTAVNSLSRRLQNRTSSAIFAMCAPDIERPKPRKAGLVRSPVPSRLRPPRMKLRHAPAVPGPHRGMIPGGLRLSSTACEAMSSPHSALRSADGPAYIMRRAAMAWYLSHTSPEFSTSLAGLCDEASDGFKRPWPTVIMALDDGCQPRPSDHRRQDDAARNRLRIWTGIGRAHGAVRSILAHREAAATLSSRPERLTRALPWMPGTGPAMTQLGAAPISELRRSRPYCRSSSSRRISSPSHSSSAPASASRKSA